MPGPEPPLPTPGPPGGRPRAREILREPTCVESPRQAIIRVGRLAVTGLTTSTGTIQRRRAMYWVQVTENRRNTMISTIRRALVRLDAWTLEVFNPYLPSDHR